MADATEQLRQSNSALSRLMASLSGPELESPVVAARLLSEVQAELNRAQHLLRASASAAAPDFLAEQHTCRSQLERLQALLSDVRARMLTEFARLGRDHSHLEAADRWRKAAREIY